MKNWLRKNLVNIILFLILFTGVGLLVYPSFSDYWNSFHQSRAIASYAEAVADIDNYKYEEFWNTAISYNGRLKDKSFSPILSEEELAEYDCVLDVSGTGIMAYIEIPKIKCYLPIYHGTDEGVLQIAIGHIQGTSLPTGGDSTHCVLSGHRGLPSAKLFTDLDKIVPGDKFIIRTLDEVLTYEILSEKDILIVEPTDVDSLAIRPGEDICTLVTCTPYGINTHRLLVTGHRVENEKELVSRIRVTADAVQIDPIIVAPAIAAPILAFVLLLILNDGGKKKRKARRKE